MKYIICFFLALMLAACGKPSGLSDAMYSEYKQLGAPKILFSCSTPAPDDDPRSIERSLKIRSRVDACKMDFGCIAKVAESTEDKPLVVEYGYRAGVGVAATYNKILGDAKRRCGGEFSIIEKNE